MTLQFLQYIIKWCVCKTNCQIYPLYNIEDNRPCLMEDHFVADLESAGCLISSRTFTDAECVSWQQHTKHTAVIYLLCRYKSRSDHGRWLCWCCDHWRSSKQQNHCWHKRHFGMFYLATHGPHNKCGKLSFNDCVLSSFDFVIKMIDASPYF